MVSGTHLLAIAVALVGALSNAAQGLFIRIGTEDGAAGEAVFVVMVVNVSVLVPLVAVVYYPTYGLTAGSWASFLAAGILGTLLGRLCLYSSIDRIGASRTMPIVAANALVGTVLGVLFLGESLSAMHGLGVVLTVVGVAAIAWETSRENPDDLSRKALLLGLLLPLGAALAYGWEPVFARYGFRVGTPAPVGLVVKTLAAAIGFTLYLWATDALPDATRLRSTDVRWFALAGLANTLFVLCYYVALAIAPVSVVTPIIVTNTLFVVVLSALFMPERLERVTWKLTAAAVVVILGVLTITVYG